MPKLAEKAEKQVDLKVPYPVFLRMIEQLSVDEKFELWKILDEELVDIEDELIVKNPKIWKRIQEAREEIEKGHYVGMEELLKLKGKKSGKI